jgi:hypothetical protein
MAYGTQASAYRLKNVQSLFGGFDLRALAATTLLIFFSAILIAHAENRALLIGVSEYRNENIPDLRGPVNDVLLMRDVLKKRGVEDIELLATGVDGAEEPTRANILRGFASLAERTEAGDLVYVHFSGHGSRQLDLQGDETDGLDEIFLPSDVEKAPDGSGTVPNALTDDEIGQLTAEIRKKGANIFLVMDSCHSGTGMRDATGKMAVRKVDSDTLGVDISKARTALSDSQQPAVTTAGDEEGWGHYQAFYATQSNDVAREVDMSGNGAGGENQWYGLFTSALAAQLETAQNLTYRQLFQSIIVDLNNGAGFGMAAIQTPLWEGDMIDQAIFGGTLKRGPARYLVKGDQIDAGILHGLQLGSLVALIADIADPADAVIGYAQIEEIESLHAYIRPVADECVPKSEAFCDFVGSLPEGARFAQIEMNPVDEFIRFSPILDQATGTPVASESPLAKRFSAALEKASEQSLISSKIEPDAYHVQAAARDGDIWFGPVANIDNEPVGLSFPSSGADEELVAKLVRILKAERLAQVLEKVGGGESFLNPSPIDVDAKLRSSDIGVLAKPGDRINPRRECTAALAGQKEEDFEALERSGDVKQCDLLRFSAVGNREGQRDVNRIHIDAQYCIHADYELIEGTKNERQLGDTMVMCSDCPGPVSYSAGYERLYLLVSETQQNSEALNLKGLVENCGPDFSGKGSRSAAGPLLDDMLKDVMQQGNTRGNMGGAGILSDAWAQSYKWRVLPRVSAFARAQGQ